MVLQRLEAIVAVVFGPFPKWNNKKDVIAYANKLGVGHTVFERHGVLSQGYSRYGICHTERAEELAAKEKKITGKDRKTVHET